MANDYEKERAFLQQVKDDYRKTFLSTPHGRRVLEDIVQYAGVLGPMMTGNSETFFRLGQRDVGLMIMKALDRRTFASLELLENDGLSVTELFPRDTEGEQS